MLEQGDNNHTFLIDKISIAIIIVEMSLTFLNIMLK